MNRDRGQQRCNICSRSTTLFALLLGGIVGHFHGRYSGKNLVEHDSSLPSYLGSAADTVTHGYSTPTQADVVGSSSVGFVVKSKRVYKEGWRTIKVFSGDTERHLKSSLQKPREWYAQARQDEIVHKLFRKKANGFFIDLAANDALSFSNTLALEIKANWTGVCIEPNPLYWHSLAYYRKCQVVAAVVGQNRMDQVDFTYRGVYGGIVSQNFDNSNSNGGSKLQFTVPLAELFEYHDVPKVIDYLSLDVEGAEEFVLRHFPFSNYTFSTVTVERPNKALSALLNETGYILLQELSKWGETLWAHTSVVPQLDLSIFDLAELGLTTP